MVKLRNGLQKVKDEYDQLIPHSAIQRACAAAGHSFRQRMLGPIETLYLFLIQILNGNVACSALRHLAEMPCSVSAYCQARGRLPVAVLVNLLGWVAQAMRDLSDGAQQWHGHRVFFVDGSSFSMPDTPDLQQAFGQPGGQRKGCGFPTAHMLVLMDAATGFILDILACPLRTHEIAHVHQTHGRLRAGDLLVADRGFCSYAHMAQLLAQGIEFVFRIHQCVIVDFTPGRAHVSPKAKNLPKGLPRSKWLRCLGHSDQVVQWQKPASRPRRMSPEAFDRLPEALTVRELRYRIETPGFRTRNVLLVTSLQDPQEYPAEELAELYRWRWQVEVNLRNLKQTMGMDVLHCKTADGVRKEMLMFALAYNLVCSVIYDAADRQGVRPDRISFVDALRWLQQWRPDRELVALIINPHRPGRVEPRVVKRRPKQYPLMREPRHMLRNRLLEKDVAA
ncbi:hypothetical protein LCGC14_2037780 [marine sediment metagenome]|uniref:Transposase IS4-like domain-containing protein n=1 Tax=marine sediment metagenome TaxID=412755 RepID=A0A0F9ESM6_9ZZZZ